MNIKSISNMQNVATLSIVFISTTSCLLRAGRNRTSFKTLSRRKVRSTDKPPSASPTISHTLKTHTNDKRECECNVKFTLNSKESICTQPQVCLF